MVSITDIVERFDILREQQQSSNKIITDLLNYVANVEKTLRDEVAHLSEQLTNTRLDLEDSIKSRRELQQKLLHAEQLLQQADARYNFLYSETEFLKTRNPYIVVLIDGDGLLFHESFIRQGIEGGKKAAYTLRNVILEHVKDNPGDYEVVARVICNMTGLAKALKRDGCIENESDFKDFTLGFTQGKATFDFIDVGYGKERADSKIRESTKWNLRNLNCIQILLGISHDAGYAPFLDEILQDDQTRRKITVIEGFPAVKELVTTGVNVLRLSPSLFRTEKLLDRVPSFPQGAPTAPAAQAKPSAPTPPPGIPAPTPPANSVSYANAIQKASPPPQITLPLQIKPATAPARPKPAPWNPGPRGLDKPIVVNQAVLEAVKKRKDNQKLCNNHYLRGPCAKGDSCCFEHNYKPNQEELNAIAYLARQNPCTNGQDCVLEGCIYGHHCPNVVNGTCMHPYCKFRVDEHPPGTKFRNPKTADH